MIGGDRRNRTADLLIANQSLSQLSYAPMSSDSRNEYMVWKVPEYKRWP